MLPTRHLDVRLDGDEVWPRWLTTRDHGWVAALADRVESLAGRSRMSVDRALADLALPDAPPAARRALAHLLLRQQAFRVEACVAPPRARAAVFALAAARPGADRAHVLAEAARRLDVPADGLAAALHADRPAFRVLQPPHERLATVDLVERYHLGLAQGLLLRASQVRARVGEQVRPVVRFARLHGLMVSLSSAPARGADVLLELSGPLSLFRHATRYGRALARWLPALTRAPRWSLEAACLLHGRRLRLRLSHRDPVGTTHSLPRRFDSRLEERLFRDLQRLDGPWRVLRDARPVRAGARLAFPDFVLVHARDGRAVSVEVVGFWTPEYLASKLELLADLPDGERWIACVDERLGVAHEARLAGIRVLPFCGRVDAAALLRRADELLSAGASPVGAARAGDRSAP